MRYLFIIIYLYLSLGTAAHAQFDHQHRTWGELLKSNVVLSDGGNASHVRYEGMASARTELKSYLAGLSQVSADEFKAWSKEQQLAFLINAYNAHMIELILTRYPNIKSVWDFGKIFNNPFRNRFFMLFGKAFSLDDVEHGMIRVEGVYDDPRIHFAVNCASVGCPMLREEPYLAARLEQQLEEQTMRFLADRKRNRHNAASGTLEVSKLFDASPWYGADFGRGWRGIRTLGGFFARYANLLTDNPDHQKLIRDQQVKIRHLDYDWSLNDAAR
jgi:Protein of unknown function, DUF547